MLPMFMLDRIFLEILPSAFLEPTEALLLDCPWILKLMGISFAAPIYAKFNVPVTPAEFSPDTLPE